MAERRPTEEADDTGWTEGGPFGTMGQGRGEATVASEGRWQRRPVIATVVRVAAIGTPLAVSIAAAALFEILVPAPPGDLLGAVWWVGVLASSTGVLLVLERLARRTLPLVALLNMGLLFPGVAPKRMAVARRAASTRDLQRKVSEAQSRGRSDEPVEAAERIVTLSASLSTHDRKTRGHTERVRALTDMVADELKLPESDRDRLRWSALLHDIGKLTVHPAILNKAESLSDEEWHLIRQHPLEGARLAAPLAGWLGDWASTIAQHHERYDGAGYPMGLAGDAISLGGRIVAVADTYDVMTHERSYKRPSTPAEARLELSRCAGSQFDPAIVRAFLAVPVRRLRGLLPFTWIGSALVDSFGPTAATASRLGGALLATASVVGLSAWKPWSTSPGTTVVSAMAHTSRPVASSTPDADGGGRRGASAVVNRSSSGPSDHPRRSAARGISRGLGPGGEGVPAEGEPGASSGGSTNAAPDPGAGPASTSTTGDSAASTAATVTTLSSLTTTTTKATTTSTSLDTSSPTTSTTTDPPPQPPTSLSATGGCSVLVVGPEITVGWVSSSSPWVSGYTILRSPDNADYVVIATVSSSTSSYADSSVSGLGTTYRYEVEATSPYGSATSATVTGTTPTLCL